MYNTKCLYVQEMHAGHSYTYNKSQFIFGHNITDQNILHFPALPFLQSKSTIIPLVTILGTPVLLLTNAIIQPII